MNEPTNEPQKKYCPYNPENSCDDCRLQVDGILGKQCVLSMIAYHLQGLDLNRGTLRPSR